MKLATVLVMSVMLCLGVIAFANGVIAQTENDSSAISANETQQTADDLIAEGEEGITPDSIFYGLDIALERISLALTFDKAKRAEKALKHAQERLAEVKAMIEKNKIEKAEEVSKKYEERLKEAEEAISEIDTDGNEEAAKEALEEVMGLRLKLMSHKEKVSYLKTRILERQAQRMSEEQIAHLSEVFQKIEERASETEKKVNLKKENAKAKLKVMTGMTDEELEKLLEEIKSRVEVREMKREFKKEFREVRNGTKVKVGGNVEISSETRAVLDNLAASFEGVEGKVELKLEIKKRNNTLKDENGSRAAEIVEEKVEGVLTDFQKELWEQLKEKALSDVEDNEGSDLELEIEIEHEIEIESSNDEDRREIELEKEIKVKIRERTEQEIREKIKIESESDEEDGRAVKSVEESIEKDIKTQKESAT